MNLLYEKQRLFGTVFRGDGGDGGGGDGGGPSGSSGASAEGSGSSSGPGGGPSGGPGSGSGSGASGGPSGDSSGSSSAGSDSGQAMGEAPGPTDTDGTESLGATTVSATADPSSDPNQGENGTVTNSVLSNLFSKGVGQVVGQISGLPPSIISNMIKGFNNPTEQNQAAIINSFMGVVPVVGPLNGLASMLGLGTIGSGIASLGGVPAGDVASDPSASGGDSSQPGLGGIFGTGASSTGPNYGAMLGMSGGDPLLASLFKGGPASPIVTNRYLKDIMNKENYYG